MEALRNRVSIQDVQLEVLVGELGAVDGFTTCPVEAREVTLRSQSVSWGCSHSLARSMWAYGEKRRTPWIMKLGMIRWKMEFLKCRGLPDLPTPFSPSPAEYRCQNIKQGCLCIHGWWRGTQRTSAQSAEVLHSLGHDSAVEVNDDAASWGAANLHIKEHLVRHRRLPSRTPRSRAMECGTTDVTHEADRTSPAWTATTTATTSSAKIWNFIFVFCRRVTKVPRQAKE